MTHIFLGLVAMQHSSLPFIVFYLLCCHLSCCCVLIFCLCFCFCFFVFVLFWKRLYYTRIVCVKKNSFSFQFRCVHVHYREGSKFIILFVFFLPVRKLRGLFYSYFVNWLAFSFLFFLSVLIYSKFDLSMRIYAVKMED